MIVKGLGENRFQGGFYRYKESELVPPERDRRGKRRETGGGYFFCGELRREKVFFSSFLLAAEKWGPFFASVVRSLRKEV